MFSKRVVVVGCGALGCRHIEGLFRSHEPIEIIGIDLTEEVQENCRNFCHQLQNDGSKMTRFFTLSDSLKETFDAVELCIVATTANGRSELLTKLNTVMSPTY